MGTRLRTIQAMAQTTHVSAYDKMLFFWLYEETTISLERVLSNRGAVMFRFMITYLHAATHEIYSPLIHDCKQYSTSGVTIIYPKCLA